MVCVMELQSSKIWKYIFRDCMKGDEMENKKIGGSVNLMVSHSRQSLKNAFMNIFTHGIRL